MREFQLTEATVLLAEVKDFLESAAPLHTAEERYRAAEGLLLRAQNVLTDLIGSLPYRNSSGALEPYLDMTANLKKSVENIINGDYVSECYETFDSQSLSPPNSSIHSTSDDQPWASRFELVDLPNDYSNLSASQAKAQAIKWAQMDQRREPRKMTFGFGFTKSCYAGIVGVHLLLYNSEQDSRPYLIVPLQGYKGRPINRASDQNSASFEIVCPGEKTFQFVAKSSRDMEEWIEVLDKLQQALDPDKTPKKSFRDATFIEILDLKPNRSVGQPKTVTPPKAPSPPPLPLRSRRLPSPPRESSRELDCNYNDDDQGLYHRIEDIRTRRVPEEYQNCKEAKNGRSCEDMQETYDDVRPESIESETYDDVLQTNRQPTYCDVGRDPSKTCNQKRSFLDRVRNRVKEPSKKEDKKKATVASSPAAGKFSNIDGHARELPRPEEIMFVAKIEIEEAPRYDDVTSLRCNSGNNGSIVAEDEYICPPPPRPIYTSPPTILNSEPDLDEIYDDIGSCRDRAINNARTNGKTIVDRSAVEIEDYYDVPKSNIRPVIPLEELYDDVQFDTLSTRQSINKDQFPPVTNGNNSSSNAWNRSGIGRKSKTSEHPNDAFADDAVKIKPLQKLINRVENSLGKVSKPPTTTTNQSTIKNSSAYA